MQKTLEFKEQSKANVNTADPGKFIVRSLGTGKDAKIEIDDTSQVYATLESPGHELNVKGNSHFYGTFIGEKATAEDEGQIHVDHRGGSDGGSYTYTIQWQEIP